MRLPLLSLTLSALLLPLALPAQAGDRDHQRSVEEGARCVAAGEARDAERLRRCCKSNVPTQARQADWDRYTEVCINAATRPGTKPASGEADGKTQSPAGSHSSSATPSTMR